MYDTLAFALTKRCTAACEICCFSSCPTDKETLNLDRVKQYIEESKDIEEIKTIAFTGGEPFLLYDDLLELVSKARNAGKRVNAITNAFWANTESIALEKLGALKSQGLNFLSLSFDSYHEKYVDVNNVRNVLRAATDLNIPTAISIVKVKNENIGHIVDRLGDAIYTSDIKVAPCLPSGRAAVNFSIDDFDRTINVDTCKCEYGGNLVVLYDGKVYPCCSQAVVDMDLSVGNFNELNLHEVMKLLKNNALLYFLRNANFSFYVDYAREKLKMDVPNKVVSPCELCSILFKDNKVDLYYEHVERMIRELKETVAK